MSDAREFDDGVAAAADALVDAYGVTGAVDELQARRLSADDEEIAKIHEALAYIRREVDHE